MPEMAQIRKVRSAGCVVRLFQLAETKDMGVFHLS